MMVMITRAIIATLQGCEPAECVAFQYFFGVCVASPGQRGAFWLWEAGSYWVISPMPIVSPFPSLAEFIFLELTLNLICYFLFLAWLNFRPSVPQSLPMNKSPWAVATASWRCPGCLPLQPIQRDSSVLLGQGESYCLRRWKGRIFTVRAGKSG